MSVEPIFVLVRDGGEPVEGGRPVLVVAGVTRRVVGRVLDVVVMGAAVALIALVATRVMEVAGPKGAAAVMGVMTVADMAVVLLLRTGALALFGWTVGQRLAGTRVVDAGTGEPFRGWRAAAGRRYVRRSRASLGVLDDLLSLTSDRALRRCDHDRRAGTIVVRAGRAHPRPPGV
ncbi:RDD family protein [Actinomadura harenae]|nr:RDD family protein [Actinomadura harenae]